MNIPVLEWRTCADRVSVGLDGRGRADWYKMGLLNVLCTYQPLNCVEIGTHKGGTTRVFEWYFKNIRPDGRLVTVDVEKFVDVLSARVKQVVLDAWSNLECPNNEPKRKANRILDHTNAYSPDFMFIDGDHSESGLAIDIEAAKLLKAPLVMLDDCRGEWPAPTKWFQEFPGEKYAFEDWPVYVGCGVVKLE